MGKPKGNKGDKGDKWGDPIWHDQYKWWYREKRDKRGGIEYDWIGPYLPGQEPTNLQTPRQFGEVTDLSANLGKLDLAGSSTYDTTEALQPQSDYTWQTSNPLVSDPLVSGPSVLEPLPLIEGKGKGLEDTTFPTASYGQSYSSVTRDTSVTPQALNYAWKVPNPLDESQNKGLGNAAFPTISYGDTYSSRYDTLGAPPAEPRSDDTWPIFNPLVKGSAIGTGLEDTLLSKGSYGDSLNVERDYSVNLGGIPPNEDPTTGTYDNTEGSSSTAPVLDVPLLGASSRNTTVGVSSGNTIPVTPRQGDDRYRVERSHKWKRGEVIKMWHAEPRGGQIQDHPLTEWTERRPQNSMERFYFGPRRFIVVKTTHGRSTCVPISTYGGQGLNKHGITPGYHSIVYSSSTTPRALVGEPNAGYPPIPVDMTTNEVLTMTSRVDYSNLKTFEHNVPVIFIGSVSEAAQATVDNAVNECWEDDTYDAAAPSKQKSKSKSKRRR